MDVFVARQPILDRSRRTWAYELLFRDGPASAFNGTDPDQATLRVIDTSFYLIGLDTLTGGQRAFVNFTRDTLVNGYAQGLPRQRLVVEILEDVTPDDEVLEACRALRRAGYMIALDDVATEAVSPQLLDVVDIAKVDFRKADPARRRHLARAFRSRGIRLVAEKVETEEEAEQARLEGFEWFQGYFFSRPVLVSGRAVPAAKQHVLLLLREVHQPEPDHARIEDVIRHDVGLALRLLSRMRSVAWGFWQPVESVRHALLMLGDRGLRSWASIVALATLGEDRPLELVVTSVIRAAFCEGLLRELGQDERTEEGFLMGLFSSIDAFLGQPLAEALDRLPLSAPVRGALLGEAGLLRRVLDLVLAWERADWAEVASLSGALGLPDETLAGGYQAAVEFGASMTGPAPARPRAAHA